MRTLTLKMMSAVLAYGVAGAAAAMAPASGTIKYRATATYSDGTSADRLYAVALDADSDGDGIGDEGWLRVRCSDGAVAAAFEYDVKAPRDVATGQASGKRMHRPFTIIKEWSAKEWGAKTGGSGASKASWDLKKMESARSAGWNIKENKGTRDKQGSASDSSAGKGADGKTMGMDDWHQVVLQPGSPDLCT